MNKLILLLVKTIGVIICIWAMTMLSLQTVAKAPSADVTGVSPWVFITALAIGGGLVLGKKVIDIAAPSIGIGGSDGGILAQPPTPLSNGTQGMGGVVDDVTNYCQKWAKKYLLVIIGLIVIIGIGAYIGDLNWKLKKANQKVGVLTEGYMPPDTQSRVLVKKNKVIVYNADGTVNETAIPRGNKYFTIDVTKKGDIRRDKLNEYMPYFTVIPHAAVLVSPKGKIDPAIGVQVIRSEAISTGVNIDVGTDLIAASITKDVLDNSNIGVFYGADKGGNTHWGLAFGVYF